MIDLDELERLSRAATPGKWIGRNDPNAFDPNDYCIGTDEDHIDSIACCSTRDGEFIAACSPTAILELLRIARQHRAVLDAMRAYLPPNGMTKDAFVSRVIEIMDPGEEDKPK